MKAPWHRLTGLSKAMAILATTAGIAFGLCSANLMFNSDGGDGKLRNFFGAAGSIAGVVVMLSLFGMLIVGLIAIVLAVVRAFRSGDRPPSITKGEE